MRKVLFLFVAAIAVATTSVFTSCSNKEAKKLGSYELTEKDGKVGIKDATGHAVLQPEYDEIQNDSVNNAVIAKQGDLSTIVVNGTIMAAGIQVESITQCEANPDYAYIKADGGKVLLWKKGSTSTFGPFTDIKLINDIVFLNSDGKWGATTLDLHGLAPRQYDKVYVVKKGETMAILVHAKEWAMYDSEGVSNGARYDIAPKKLEKQVKELGLGDAEVGVAEVNWNL